MIVSWVKESGFFGDKQLRANKLSSTGKKLWGKSNLAIFDEGSLQFGNFPYFIPDGSGGAIFSWYTSTPICNASRNISAPMEARRFRTTALPVPLTPTTCASIRPYPIAQKPTKPLCSGLRKTATSSITESPVRSSTVRATRSGTRPGWCWSHWFRQPDLRQERTDWYRRVGVRVDSPGYGLSTMQAAKLAGKGRVTCAPFAVSSAPADKYGLSLDTARSGLAAVAWTDDRIGNNSIYIQNVNPNCSLGPQQ